MSYYFDDGVLKTNFNPVDAKISELYEYGYEFDHLEFLVDTLGGIDAGGALDFLKQFYNTANEIYQQNTLAFDLIILNLPIIKNYLLGYLISFKIIYIIMIHLRKLYMSRR